MPADSTSPSVPDLQRRVDELAAELRARRTDHEEALRREEAVAEILQVTNASGGDLALVLNAIIEKATRLCSASYGYIWTYDGETARAVACTATHASRNGCCSVIPCGPASTARWGVSCSADALRMSSMPRKTRPATTNRAFAI